MEQVLQDDGYIQRPGQFVGLLARYYKAEGYQKNDIHGMVEEFLLKNDPSTNLVKWQPFIERVVKDCDKYPLVDIDYIPVTSGELDIIRAIGSVQEQRLLFTLICIAKLNNAINPKNHNWTNVKDRDIFMMANIQAPIKKQSIMFHNLRGLGLIKFSRAVDNVNICVTCLGAAEEPAVVISDLRNLGHQYSRLNGEQMFECVCCGLVCKKKTNNQKYCPECATDVRKQRYIQTKNLEEE